MGGCGSLALGKAGQPFSTMPNEVQSRGWMDLLPLLLLLDRAKYPQQKSDLAHLW